MKIAQNRVIFYKVLHSKGFQRYAYYKISLRSRRNKVDVKAKLVLAKLLIHENYQKILYFHLQKTCMIMKNSPNVLVGIYIFFWKATLEAGMLG